jgi:hypothetical protein
VGRQPWPIAPLGEIATCSSASRARIVGLCGQSQFPIKAAKDNKNGYAQGDWVCYLVTKYGLNCEIEPDAQFG